MGDAVESDDHVDCPRFVLGCCRIDRQVDRPKKTSSAVEPVPEKPTLKEIGPCGA